MFGFNVLEKTSILWPARLSKKETIYLELYNQTATFFSNEAFLSEIFFFFFVEGGGEWPHGLL